MSKNSVKGLKLAVLTMCCLNLTSMIISPTLPGVAREFSEISITWIQNLSVMSSLTAIISAQMSGYVMKYIPKRYLAIVSFVLYIMSGLMVIGTNNFTAMVLLRCLNGFALGFNSTLSTSMIAEYFEGDERKRIMGLRMPFQNVTAMIFSASSGAISEMWGWRFSYILFLSALIPLTLGALFLPLIKPGNASNDVGEKGFGYRALFKEYKGIVMICLVHMLAVLATGINSTNIALMVSEKGFGDSALGGLVTAVYLLSASIAGILFGKVNNLMGKNLYPVAALLVTVGLLLASMCTSVPVLIASEILVGFWWSMFMARMNVVLAVVANNRTRNIVFSFFMATMNLGTFINPFVSTKITGLINRQGAASRVMVGAVIMISISIFTFAINNMSKSRKQMITF